MSLSTRLKNINIKYHPEKLFYSPEWLVLGVNNLCNLHCKMCDVGTGFTESIFYQNLMGTKPFNMPLELAKRIIDQSSVYFPDVKIGYAFTEPIIYPYLIESLKYADEKNFYTSITTNALTLRQTAEELCNAGLDDIFISLDGPPDIHNKIRGHNSSFQRAMEGIDKLLAHNSHPEISVYCVITKWNVGHLKEFADIFSSIPLKQLGFLHTNFITDEIAEVHNAAWGKYYPATISNAGETDISSMNLELLHSELTEIKKNKFNFPVTFSPNLKLVSEIEKFYKYPDKFIGSRCNDAFRNIMIKADGSVIPSHGRCYNITTGNIYEQSLKEIWNSAVISKFRQDLIKAGGLLPACSRCCSAF